MTLPWYLRPIEPSRWPWLGPALSALFVLALFVAIGTFVSDSPPGKSPGPMVLIVAGVGWIALGWRVTRWRRSGERLPSFSVPGAVLGVAGATVSAIPPVLWPHLPEDAPLPPHVSTTIRVCWCAAGLLLAVGIYLALTYTRRPSTRQAS